MSIFILNFVLKGFPKFNLNNENRWGRGDDGRLGTGAKGDVYKPKSITEDL